MSRFESPSMNVNVGAAKAVAIVILALIVIGVVTAASVKIVDAGHRGVLLHWSAVDTAIPPLDEGLHFVVPFADDVINIEVRTLKYEKSTTSASKDLQNVATTVTVNYHPSKESVHFLYKDLGLDYENRVIQPAIDETVKQITANYNAEELSFSKETTPESKDMMVLGHINRGYKTFNEIRKRTGIDSKDLNSILEDLESRGLMKVQKKQGMIGIKVELIPTEKGYREYDS